MGKRNDCLHNFIYVYQKDFKTNENTQKPLTFVDDSCISYVKSLEVLLSNEYSENTKDR